GFTVPFMFAIGALVTGRFGEGWLADTRRATLVAWGFLTIGIILGAWWSYEVLGWGGFWAWDPVENASLLPWITGTAFIHSVAVPRQQPVVRGTRIRRAARHGLPLDRPGAARQPLVGWRAVLRPHDYADRPRAAVPHGRRARPAVACDQRGGGATTLAAPRVG